MKINLNVDFNSPQNFRGAVPLRSYIASGKNARNEKYVREVSRRFRYLLNETPDKSDAFTYSLNNTRLSFLDRLIKKYQQRNYNRIANLREDPAPIERIVDSVKNPTFEHFEIASRMQGSFDSLEKIFSLAKGKEELTYVQDLQHGALRGNPDSSATIISLLESKNASQYAHNAETYNSYLKLNAGKKDAVKNLDSMVDNGTFSRKKYDAEIAVKNMLRNKAIGTLLEDKEAALVDGYSKEGETVLRSLFKDFFLHKKNPSEQNIVDVINIYKTTTAENLNQRLDIIRNFKFSHLWQGKKYRAQEEISSMNELFNLADKDKNVSRFLEKSLNNDLKTESVTELKEIAETVDLTKATFFFKNFRRIINGTKGEERANALKTQLDNPYFRPKDSKEKGSFFTRIFNAIEYRISKYRYDSYMKKHA